MRPSGSSALLTPTREGRGLYATGTTASKYNTKKTEKASYRQIIPAKPIATIEELWANPLDYIDEARAEFGRLQAETSDNLAQSAIIAEEKKDIEDRNARIKWLHSFTELVQDIMEANPDNDTIFPEGQIITVPSAITAELKLDAAFLEKNLEGKTHYDIPINDFVLPFDDDLAGYVTGVLLMCYVNGFRCKMAAQIVTQRESDEPIVMPLGVAQRLPQPHNNARLFQMGPNQSFQSDNGREVDGSPAGLLFDPSHHIGTISKQKTKDTRKEIQSVYNVKPGCEAWRGKVWSIPGTSPLYEALEDPLTANRLMIEYDYDARYFREKTENQEDTQDITGKFFIVPTLVLIDLLLRCKNPPCLDRELNDDQEIQRVYLRIIPTAVDPHSAEQAVFTKNHFPSATSSKDHWLYAELTLNFIAPHQYSLLYKAALERIKQQFTDGGGDGGSTGPPAI